MSDSGSESSSSEGYDGRRGRSTGADDVMMSSPSSRHQRDSPVSGSIYSTEKSPARSDVSVGESMSLLSAPMSPKSQRSGIMSPKSQRSGIMSPKSQRSEIMSPKSQRSEVMSPKSQRSDMSPKSQRSGITSPKSPSNASPSPRSVRSMSKSPPASPKSYHSDNRSVESPASDRSSSSFRPTRDSRSNALDSAKSPLSYKNSGSRHSSSLEKSPRSGQSSVRSSPKSYKSIGASLDDHESDRHSHGGASPVQNNSSFNQLENLGEQISDGDIEDEPESIPSESKPTPATTPTPITHGEDLSDVSDLESNDGVDGVVEHVECERNDRENQKNEENRVNSHSDQKEQEKISSVSLVEETEQLDFEADGQWKDERDEGEPEGLMTKEHKENNEKDGKEKEKGKNEKKDRIKETGEITEKEEGEEDGEKVESELEEGELSDGDDARPEETEPRPVCRFYNRGQCTWGVSCRFLHPGVTDKGNYTMFDMVRPMAYPPHAAPPHEYRPHIERPPPPIVRPIMNYGGPPHPPKAEELPTESAWERGLRHAKEMMRKANKRKESDMDFEEKKMNLSLGQDEMDREAGYYVRAATPEPLTERYAAREAPRRIPPPRITPERYIDEPEAYYPPPPPPAAPPSSAPMEYYRRVHYKSDPRAPAEYRERIDYHAIPRGAPHSVSPPPHPRERERDREREREREREYYEKYEKKHKRPSREVIVERIPPTKTWREDEPPPVERGRGDEWADPWMRRKSPSAVRRNAASSRRPRRQSYSSGSSYSSTSSSRSSSRSSYSSYDSLSRSRSPSPPSRSRGAGGSSGKGKAVITSPSTHPATAAPPQRGAMLMNPPAPSPRLPKGSISPTGTLHRRAGLNPPAPSPLSSHQRHHEKTRDKAALAAAAVAKVIKSRSRSSSSGSESSGSSSDSTESSYSSSSSETRRRKGSSPASIRKDSKGIDALKLSGTKQQIKLTLKPTNSTSMKKVERSALVAGKKRGHESPPLDSKASVAAAAAKAAKKASSRREELLKQLKAVEDAIARKRSKV
ncbi:zinc finger CCCH domain-containing protein 18-like isoform X2 [Prorops nasuta]|uniref:zinc finger CCCH domain-containing protein 18-like isoform X2 n=1 Tax=Prorops nasuta TaxID=863751 RepID=UPI0034CFC66B